MSSPSVIDCLRVESAPSTDSDSVWHRRPCYNDVSSQHVLSSRPTPLAKWCLPCSLVGSHPYTSFLKNTKTSPDILNEGIGFYALKTIATGIFIECREVKRICNRPAIVTDLTDSRDSIDCLTYGSLRHCTGQLGITPALGHLRDVCNRSQNEVIYA